MERSEKLQLATVIVLTVIAALLGVQTFRGSTPPVVNVAPPAVGPEMTDDERKIQHLANLYAIEKINSEILQKAYDSIRETENRSSTSALADYDEKLLPGYKKNYESAAARLKAIRPAIQSTYESLRW